MALEIFTLRERPEFRSQVFAERLQEQLWPEFMRHDPVARLYFNSPFFERYVDFAFAGVDDGAVVARAFSVPFAFGIEGRSELPDGGWDEVIWWAHEDASTARAPTAVSALEISLVPAARGAGNSYKMLAAMKANARRHGFSDLFAPVRPNQKDRRPLMSIADYVRLTRDDGLPEDAWLRTHVRAGGRIVKVAPYAMTIVGAVADWSHWTGMQFAASGNATVPGALAPVQISLENDCGVYIEPGVWVHHPL